MKRLAISSMLLIIVLTCFLCGTCILQSLATNVEVDEPISIKMEEPTTANKVLYFESVRLEKTGTDETEDLILMEDEEELAVFMDSPETAWELEHSPMIYTIYDSIPMSSDLQKSLQEACEEFDVPYALALGLIDTESDFTNLIGDGGYSKGYMQIQQRFHSERMRNLGVADLMDPSGNFRVGLSLLSELKSKYGTWEAALTAYNRGHYPGYTTYYATSVLNDMHKWAKVVGE